MSSNTKQLTDKIEELESKLEALSERCHDLEWRMRRMAVSKSSHPRFPYWNWILKRGTSEETMQTLNHLLSTLCVRVAGMQTPDEQQKDIGGVPRDVLYGSAPLRIEDAFAAIKSVVGMMDDWQVVNLIQAVDGQGMFQELCEYILSSLQLTFSEKPDDLQGPVRG